MRQDLRPKNLQPKDLQSRAGLWRFAFPRFCRAIFLAAGLFGLAACDRYGGDIEAVKAAQTLGDERNEQLCLELAGARGTFDWLAGPARGYESDDRVVGVTCRIERIGASGQARVIELQFIHNRQTAKVALDRVTIDGEPQSLLGGALNLLLMQLE